MPKKQIVAPTNNKEERDDSSDEDNAAEFADIEENRKINTKVVNSGPGKSEWQVTNIKEERDDSCDEDATAEFAEIAVKEEFNPIIVIDTYGTREGRGVIHGKKKKKKNNVNNVTPNCQLYIKCVPPLLASEIKELHPDIVFVKALRQKGKYFVTFPNKMACTKALEDLRKMDVKGHTLRVNEYRERKDHDVPFLCARPTSKREQRRRDL